MGSLVTGDHFTGCAGTRRRRDPGTYGIARGTLALSANYDLTFTGAVFTDPADPVERTGRRFVDAEIPEPEAGLHPGLGSESNLTTQGQGASQGGGVAGGQVIAALRWVYWIAEFQLSSRP